MTNDPLTPRWYRATTPTEADPLLSRDCQLWMPPAMVASLRALGWQVSELESVPSDTLIETGETDDDNG